MYTYKDLQDEVKRRAVRDQSGTQFDTAVKNIINTSLFRLAREALWRPLRRKTFFNTVTTNDTGDGSGSFTNGSTTIYATSANWVTDEIKVGRRIKLDGDGTYHTIRAVTSETSLEIEEGYNGTSTNAGGFSILPQEEYNLPIQASHRVFLWHEEWGYPYQMTYITDQDFYALSLYNTRENIPVYYRMWGEDMVINQPQTASNLTVWSTAGGDTSIGITIFGTVSGYPDYEQISTDGTNGTTPNSGNKTFSNIDRVVKNGATTGRIEVWSNTTSVNVAVLPIGDTTGGIKYAKVQLYALPNTSFPINVQYYKDPYRLVNDDDVHELGHEFDEAIILLSVAKIKYENSQKEGDRWYSLYQDEVRSLRKNNVDKIDWYPTMRRPGIYGNDALHNTLGYQQVGPYYGPFVRGRGW